MTDDRTAVKLKQGDKKALLKLINKYSGYLAVIVGEIGKENFTREDVEETVADCFIKLWSLAPDITITGGELRAYAAVTARNIAVRKLKGRGIEYLPPGEDTLLPADSVPAPDGEQDNAVWLNRCIERMPEPDRDIFVLRYFYFYTVKEIARSLSINAKTVESKLQREKEKLKCEVQNRGMVHEEY